MNNPLADMLAQQGRKGDTQVGHLTPGELIIPDAILNSIPGLAEMVAQAFANAGADIEQYRVGGEGDSINPATGVPEYAYDDGGYGSENEGTGGFGGYSGNGGSVSGGGYGSGGIGPSAPGEDDQGNSLYGGATQSYSLPDNQRGEPPAGESGERWNSYNNAMDSVHGGGVMGSLGRGLEGIFGVERNFGVRGPDAMGGVQRNWNPGSLLGALPGLGGVLGGQLGQMAYTASGLPKPSLGYTPSMSPLAQYLAGR